MSADAQRSTRPLWDLLPPELQEKIIDDVYHCHSRRSGDKIRGYVLNGAAATSRKLQQLVERRTFKTLTLTTKDFSTTTTENILHSTQRLGHVEILLVELCLVGQDILQTCPLAKPSEGAPSPVASKVASDCQCPTCTVVALFKLLKPAPKWHRPYINLTISIEGHTERGPAVLRCFQLAQPEENLLCLPMVRCLKIPKSNCRVFMPDSACRIASRLTQLEIFSYEGTWGESEGVIFEENLDIEAIRQARNDFAKTLGRLPPTLREFEIDYTDWFPSSDNISPDDELSKALCTFSHRENLTKFSVDASLGLSIFDSSVRPYSQGLTWYFVVFKDDYNYDDAIFFGQMAKRGAAVAQRLSSDVSIRLYHIDRFFVYERGKLYICDERSDNLWKEGVITAWEQTAVCHSHDLVVRLNKSPSDDEETNYSDDDPDDELDESNGTLDQNLAEGLDDNSNGIGGPSPDSSSTISW